jgi:hypothetical protein
VHHSGEVEAVEENLKRRFRGIMLRDYRPKACVRVLYLLCREELHVPLKGRSYFTSPSVAHEI